MPKIEIHLHIDNASTWQIKSMIHEIMPYFASVYFSEEDAALLADLRRRGRRFSKKLERAANIVPDSEEG